MPRTSRPTDNRPPCLDSRNEHSSHSGRSHCRRSHRQDSPHSSLDSLFYESDDRPRRSSHRSRNDRPSRSNRHNVPSASHRGPTRTERNRYRSMNPGSAFDQITQRNREYDRENRLRTHRAPQEQRHHQGHRLSEDLRRVRDDESHRRARLEYIRDNHPLLSMDINEGNTREQNMAILRRTLELDSAIERQGVDYFEGHGDVLGQFRRMRLGGLL